MRERKPQGKDWRLTEQAKSAVQLTSPVIIASCKGRLHYRGDCVCVAVGRQQNGTISSKEETHPTCFRSRAGDVTGDICFLPNVVVAWVSARSSEHMESKDARIGLTEHAPRKVQLLSPVIFAL
jgi:hypothetical protein